ncbi:hypothetical protein PHYSODRAFT_289208 [Phytophthora sojae]|uniref:RXLR phytopathogen effector protein WY-domain domain-containing protein n=1 Tax=Phytophthora sojae (strain P6497) TaxID=1094619 RepID=G5AFH6_PHYSP|nr:hypothetical protein PHYSODRAFT_289208 [Phytophthora sojae]EGZ05966.1 hypothetical protein PHYSODRAFT_289208 [Phytophthora sojae]|eukprot:XP_009538827.1 hypothetical protein PHYSODRAFT_289208 [Phytophthora sojae]
MFAQRIVLLAVIFLFWEINAAVARRQADQVTDASPNLRAADQNQAALERLLWSYDSRDEERRCGWSAKELDELFQKLDIATGRLDDNSSAASKWFTAIAKYRKAKKANFWYPDDFIYAKLRETHSEADIAVLCQKLMNTSKAKKVAKTLQHHLFQAWNNRGMRLEDVADMLGVLVSTANSVRSGILVDYQLKLTGEAVTRVRHG